jgi:hypothetical protein
VELGGKRHLNATQAAIRAGYSAKSARVVGCRSITKANIAAAIEKARTKRAERTELTQDWVVDELRKIAGANMLDYMNTTSSALDCQHARLHEVDPRGRPLPRFFSPESRPLLDAKHKQPDAPIEVTVEELRATVLRALARLHDARRAGGDRRGNEPGTIEGTSTRVERPMSPSLVSPNRVSLPRFHLRIGLHIVLFEACAAFTCVAACTLARSPYVVTAIRRLQTLRLLHACSGRYRLERSPGGACTHGKSAALSRRTWTAAICGPCWERE